tara:strand:- start:4595 stop:4810 length:216 start_codon:yes stop_codon:yes gene_type:complete
MATNKKGNWKKIKLMYRKPYEDVITRAYERLEHMYSYNYANSFNEETWTPHLREELPIHDSTLFHMEYDDA